MQAKSVITSRNSLNPPQIVCAYLCSGYQEVTLPVSPVIHKLQPPSSSIASAKLHDTSCTGVIYPNTLSTA